jgi:hypothetical protein
MPVLPHSIGIGLTVNPNGDDVRREKVPGSFQRITS